MNYKSAVGKYLSDTSRVTQPVVVIYDDKKEKRKIVKKVNGNSNPTCSRLWFSAIPSSYPSVLYPLRSLFFPQTTLDEKIFLFIT